VFGLLDREARKVRAKAVLNVKRETLLKEILAQVERKSSIYIDSSASYDCLSVRDFIHETENHVEEYVRGEVHTNG
jgi:transposase-like protein